MPVPDFQSFFKPVLDIASDGQEHSLREARQKVASLVQLSENDLSERLPSGIQTKFENRISWEISYFVQVSLYYGDFSEGSLSIGSRRGLCLCGAFLLLSYLENLEDLLSLPNKRK